MAGFQFTIMVALFSVVALVGILPVWGDQSNEELTQLKAQIQDVIQRLERLENGERNCEPDRYDEADFQSLQTFQEGPEGAAVAVRAEPESIAQLAPLSLAVSKGQKDTSNFKDSITATIAERVTQLESIVKVLTEGISNI